MVAGWFQVFCPEQWVWPAGIFCQWAVATPETTWDAPIGWGGHLPERRGFTHLHRQCHQRGTVQAQGWVPPTCQHSCNSLAVPSGLNTHPCPSNLLISPLLVMALRNRCGIRLSFCKGNKLFTLFFLFFVLVSQPLMPKRGNTGWADCRFARSTTQRPWARYDVCVECFHEGIFTAGHNVHYWSLHFRSFAGISSILFWQFKNVQNTNLRTE